MSVSMRILRVHLFIWRVCGVWPLPNDHIAYKIYCVLVHFVASILFNGCILAYLIHNHKWADIVLCLMPATTTVLTSVKMILLVRNQPKLLKMFAIMKRLEAYASFEINANRERLIFSKALRSSFILLGFISASSYSAITFAFLRAYFSDEKIFLWPGAFPFDYESDDRLYYFALFFQYISNLYVGLIYTSVDIYGPVLYIVLSVYLDTLGLRLEQLGSDPTENVDQTKTGQDKSPDELTKAENNLRDCIEYHNLCLQYTIFTFNL